MESKLGSTTITRQMLEAVVEVFDKGSEEAATKIAQEIDTAKPKSRLHPWLHPTKGWRMFARPRKTNRRRKLIPQGRLMILPLTAR